MNDDIERSPFYIMYSLPEDIYVYSHGYWKNFNLSQHDLSLSRKSAEENLFTPLPNLKDDIEPKLSFISQVKSYFINLKLRLF